MSHEPKSQDPTPPASPEPTTPDTSNADGGRVRYYEFGPFRLDVVGRLLIKDGEVVALTAKVYDTLAVLVKNHARAVPKEELIQAVWPSSFVSDDSLVQNISALRRALKDDSSQPRYIATLARRGYRFIAPTTEVTEAGLATPPAATPAAEASVAAAKAPEPTPLPTPPAPPAPAAHWFTRAAVAVGVALILVIALVWTATRSASAPSRVAIRFEEVLPSEQALREIGRAHV